MQLETGWNCQSAHACLKCCHFQGTKEDWGIKSLKETAETLRLSQRVKQKFSKNEESRQIWESTSAKNINIDFIISRSKDRSSALKILKEKHIETNF